MVTLLETVVAGPDRALPRAPHVLGLVEAAEVAVVARARAEVVAEAGEADPTRDPGVDQGVEAAVTREKNGPETGSPAKARVDLARNREANLETKTDQSRGRNVPPSRNPEAKPAKRRHQDLEAKGKKDPVAGPEKRRHPVASPEIRVAQRLVQNPVIKTFHVIKFMIV